MTQVVSIHSFRGGTGKSNITAGLAGALARTGAKVGIVDTDIQSPGIHVLFGMDVSNGKKALNDYLWDRCRIEEAAHDVSSAVGLEAGRVYLIPSSLKAGEIARVLREGYDVGRLADGFRAIGERLGLDVLLIDTHPGINEETLLSITISDTLVVVLRPDRQDFQGTAVTVDVARKLEVPEVLLVVNKIPSSYDSEDVRAKVQDAYGAEVAAMLPHSDELMALASEGVFSVRHPDHPIAIAVASVAARLQA